MPTYVYIAREPGRGCEACAFGFELIQKITDPPLETCPTCQSPVQRVIFPPSVVVKGATETEVEKKIREHEKEGRWSHAAEMADKEAEKTKREDLKIRALEDYKKAGYDFSGDDV